MSIKRSKDLRVRRTRKWLQDSLSALMKEKPFQDIQITEITERAQVSRPTFYMHYRSKEELLLSYVDTIFEEFRVATTAELARGKYDPRKFCVMLFEYWERYADSLERVINADVQDVLLERLRQYVAIVMADLAPFNGRDMTVPHMRAFVADYIAGGAYMLLTGWILQKMPCTAETMGTLFYELSFPGTHPAA